MPKTFKVLEIAAPVVTWKSGGSYVACPSEWAGRKVKVLPEGLKRSFEAEVKPTASGGAYVAMDKEFVGKQVNIKPLPAE